MDSLYIVMPAYNEELNIEHVVKQWYPLLEGKSDNSRLVIADSGSKDNTHRILEDMKNNGYPKLEILSDTNQYHGPKVIALYKYAIKNNIDYIFQTDSDGQTNPEEFNQFWEKRNDYDGIFGNRVERGDGKSRKFVEQVVCLLLRIYFGVDVPDANAPFRLMKTKVVEKYIGYFDDDYNLPNIMITMFFKRFNEKMLFIPITFKPRQAGVNSINFKRIIGIGWNALGDFSNFKKEMKAND